MVAKAALKQKKRAPKRTLSAENPEGSRRAAAGRPADGPQHGRPRRQTPAAARVGGRAQSGGGGQAGAHPARQPRQGRNRHRLEGDAGPLHRNEDAQRSNCTHCREGETGAGAGAPLALHCSSRFDPRPVRLRSRHRRTPPGGHPANRRNSERRETGPEGGGSPTPSTPWTRRNGNSTTRNDPTPRPTASAPRSRGPRRRPEGPHRENGPAFPSQFAVQRSAMAAFTASTCSRASRSRFVWRHSSSP